MLMNSTRHLVITFILSTVVLVTIVLVNMLFTSDMLSITREGSFLSNIGIILWCVAATVCFFASVLLSNNQHQDIHLFLVYSALLNVYLLFDDFFMLHEHYFPNYLNIDEKIIYIILGLAISILVVRFRQTILRTNYIVMLMALGFLVISVAADGIFYPIEIVNGILIMVVASSFYLFALHRSIFKEYLLVAFMIFISLCGAFAIIQTNARHLEYLFEDGAKWLGIASWCSYYIYTAYQLVLDSYANGATKQPEI